MSNSKSIKQSTSEFLVVTGYVIYIIEEILNFTQFRHIPSWTLIRQFITIMTALMLVASIFAGKRKNVKWFFSSILLIAVGAAVIISSDQLSQTAIIILFIVASSSIKSYRLFKYHWIIVSTLLVFTLLLYVLGIYEPDSFYKIASDGSVLNRYYLGFSYTTYPPNYLIHLMFSFYASRRKDIRLLDAGIFLAANYLFYRLTYTYAAFYEIILLILMLWLLKVKPKWFATKIFGFISTIFMPLLAIISIVLAVYYDPRNPIILLLNQLLSSRLRLAHQGVMMYGLKLFGNPVEWVGGRYGIERFDAYFYVDSSYVNIALTYGMVVLVLIAACFAIISYKAYKRGNYKLCLIFVFLALHSFTDPQLLELKYNPFLSMILCAFIPSMEHLLDIGKQAGTSVSAIKKKSKRKIRFRKRSVAN